MLHLAHSNVNIIAPVAGMQNIFGQRSLEESKSAQTRDSIYYYVVTSYDFAIEGLKK
jgi:hypothetical protein